MSTIHRLYDGAPRAASEVARLSGYVRYVDGRDLSKLSGTYEILPGCHVVQTPEHWGQGDLTGGVTATTGAVPFAMLMRPNRSYSVFVEGHAPTGPRGNLELVAIEHDASGTVTARFAPLESPNQLTLCRQQAHELGWR